MAVVPNDQQQDFNRSGLTVCQDRVFYTGQRAERVPSGLAKLVGIECTSLDLSFNELTSVSGVKDFARLQELVLDNNQLRDLKTLPNLPQLTLLSLNNNKICDLDAALERISKCCPRLSYVSLLGNPGCPDQLSEDDDDDDDYERYRLYAIHVLPETLRFLDSRVISKNERLQAQRRGKFLKTVRPKIIDDEEQPKSSKEFNEAFFHINYTPLPVTRRDPQDHKSAYGKCRYRYSGKNSEGNRFIRNSDL